MTSKHKGEAGAPADPTPVTPYHFYVVFRGLVGAQYQTQPDNGKAADYFTNIAALTKACRAFLTAPIASDPAHGPTNAERLDSQVLNLYLRSFSSGPPEPVPTQMTDDQRNAFASLFGTVQDRNPDTGWEEDGSPYVFGALFPARTPDNKNLPGWSEGKGLGHADLMRLYDALFPQPASSSPNDVKAAWSKIQHLHDLLSAPSRSELDVWIRTLLLELPDSDLALSDLQYALLRSLFINKHTFKVIMPFDSSAPGPAFY